jgi:hypothetical protein
MPRPHDVSNPEKLAHEIAEDAISHGEDSGDMVIAVRDMEVALGVALTELEEDKRRDVLDGIEDDGCLESEWSS